VYTQLTPEERETWQTEIMQREEAENRGIDTSSVSVCDGAYINSEGE